MSSVALSLLGNVPRRQSRASQPQKHMSCPPARQIKRTIHSENKNTLPYIFFTGIHSWLLMEISAIRLKRKGFNVQWKETKAMKVHGLKKKQQNNRTSRYMSELHDIGKCNKCVECCFCFWCAAGVDPDSEFTTRTLKKKNFYFHFSSMVSLRETTLLIFSWYVDNEPT